MTDRIARARAAAHEETSSIPSFMRSGTAWAEVTPLTDDLYRIRLGGMLKPSWMIGVCKGLAQARISIDRAHARRLAHDGTWIAELHVIALAHSVDPMQLPLITLAESADMDQAEPLALRGYELSPSTDHGGTLHLTLTAQDSVGLLGSLLAAFASLSLLPVEMHIETRGSEAHDCLWLAAAGAKAPGQADWHALDRLLLGSVQH